MSQSCLLSKEDAMSFFNKVAKAKGVSLSSDAGWRSVLNTVFDDELTLDNLRYGLYVIHRFALLSRHSVLKGPRFWGYEMVIAKNNWRFYYGDYMPLLNAFDYSSLERLRADAKKYEELMLTLGFGFKASCSIRSHLLKYAFSSSINLLHRCRGDKLIVITRDRVDELFQVALDYMQSLSDSVVSYATKFFLSPVYELSFFDGDASLRVRSRSIDTISKYIPYSFNGVCAYCGFPLGNEEQLVPFSLYYTRRNNYTFVRSGYVHKTCLDKLRYTKGFSVK